MNTRAKLTDDDLEEIREIFSHYDHDGNGVIDAGEFRALLDALGADLSDDEIATGLRAVDENGNGQIEFDEFLEWWANQ